MQLDTSTTYHPPTMNFSDDGIYPITEVTPIKYSLMFCYLVVFLCCFFGNIIVLLVIGCQKPMRTTTNFFLANLAIADLLVGIFCVLQNAAQFGFLAWPSGHWPFGKEACHLYNFFLHFIPNASAGILVLLSIERYLAVLKPMLVGRVLTRPVLGVSTAVVWLLSLLMNAPYLYFARYMTFDGSFAVCTRRFDRHTYYYLRLAHTVNLVVWYLLPLLLMVVIYLNIGVVLLRSAGSKSIVARSSHVGGRPSGASTSIVTLRNKLPHRDRTLSGTDREAQSVCSPALLRAMVSHEITTDIATTSSATRIPPRAHSESSTTRATRIGSASATTRHSVATTPVSLASYTNKRRSKEVTSANLDAIDSRRRVVRLVIAIVFAFAFLCLPHYSRLIWTVWRTRQGERCLDCFTALLQPISYLLLFVNSAINPILYAFFSERFRTAMADTVKCHTYTDRRQSGPIVNKIALNDIAENPEDSASRQNNNNNTMVSDIDTLLEEDVV